MRVDSITINNKNSYKKTMQTILRLKGEDNLDNKKKLI